MKTGKKKLSAILSLVVCASALTACSTDPQMSKFDTPKPWETSESDIAYEKLGYTVAVYNTEKGTSDDKRVLIASGNLEYILEEIDRTGTGGSSKLNCDMSVVYNDSAPQADKGKTDSIESETVFYRDSLSTSTMKKTVALDKREGKDDLSYSLEVDYGTGLAKRSMYGKSSTMKIPSEQYFDNETMYFITRATPISKNSTSTFKMTSVFDCFLNGEFVQNIMTAKSDASLSKLDIGEWIKPYVISEEQEKTEKEENKDQKNLAPTRNADAEKEEAQPFTLPCFKVSIMTNEDNHGPAQVVYYSERPIEINGKRHKKLPVKMTYSLYSGSKQTRQYEYTLTSATFDK